jgi:hypothetical protein
MEKNANNTTNNASAPSDPTRYLTKLVWAWEVQDVVAWAREVLESPEQSLNILRAQGITGSTLFDPPVLRFSDLVALLPGVPTSMTKRMWDEIELLQRSHDGPGTERKQDDDRDGEDLAPPRKKSKSEFEHIISATTVRNTWCQSFYQYNVQELPPVNINSYVTRALPWAQRSVDSTNIVDVVLNSMREIIADWNLSDVRSIPLFAVSGGSGIGKTRFGVELLSSLQ